MLGKARPSRHNRRGTGPQGVSVPEQAANLRADFILKAMIAVGSAAQRSRTSSIGAPLWLSST